MVQSKTIAEQPYIFSRLVSTTQCTCAYSRVLEAVQRPDCTFTSCFIAVWNSGFAEVCPGYGWPRAGFAAGNETGSKYPHRNQSHLEVGQCPRDWSVARLR